MKIISLCLFFTLISCSNLPSKNRTDKLSILQGVTNTKEVEFSVVAKKGQVLRFELRDPEGEIIAPSEVKIVSRDFSSYVVHKVLFSREQHKEYNLYAYQGEKIVDQRLVGKGQREINKLRLAVVSCLDDFYPEKFRIWDQLALKNPEYMLLIGDNVYADLVSKGESQATNPEIIWNRYTDARLSLPLYYQEKLIPVHGLWDDHDYGINNGDENFHYKKESQEVFEAFFAQDISEDDWTKAYGVGGYLSLGDFSFYFLDGRSFRAKESSGRQLGLDQNAWFLSKVREEASPSFIVMGDQFFGGYHRFESFEGSHPQDFKDFVGQLKQITTPFIFLSGDRHLSEIMQFPRSLFGKPSFEITSSPMHGPTYSEDQDNNPWRVVANKNHTNFTIVDSVAEDNHWFMDVENIGEHGEVYYKRELAVYIKDLQDNLKEARKRRDGKRRYRKARPRRR